MGIYCGIEKLLKINNMSIRQLALRSGVPATTIYSMKTRDSNKADIFVLKKIADVFGVSLNYFVTYDYESSISLNDEEAAFIAKRRLLDEHGENVLNKVMECEADRIDNISELNLNIAAKGNGEIQRKVMVDINKVKASIDELYEKK